MAKLKAEPINLNPVKPEVDKPEVVKTEPATLEPAPEPTIAPEPEVGATLEPAPVPVVLEPEVGATLEPPPPPVPAKPPEVGATLVEPVRVPVTLRCGPQRLYALHHPYFDVKPFRPGHSEGIMIPYMDSWAQCQVNAGELEIVPPEDQVKAPTPAE